MNTECLSTYCPPRSLLSSYSGTLSNPEITLNCFFFFFLHLPKLLQVRMYSSSLPLAFPSPTHFQKPTYTFSPRLDFLPPVPVKRALSTANSFLNNYTYHCWFCNFLGLSLYLLARKNDIMTAMNLLEFTWKLRWQGVCLGTLRSMSKYCKCSINVFVIIMKWIIIIMILTHIVNYIFWWPMSCLPM